MNNNYLGTGLSSYIKERCHFLFLSGWTSVWSSVADKPGEWADKLIWGPTGKAAGPWTDRDRKGLTDIAMEERRS